MKPLTPSLTVDIIIEFPPPSFDTANQKEDHGIVLIERKNSPYGWALPGGFVDIGESIEQAAVREAQEETSLQVELEQLLYVYSHPSRDKRGHNVSAVFMAKVKNKKQILRAEDDAKNANVFSLDNLPDNIVFDHKKILHDYYRFKKEALLPTPQEVNSFYEML